MTSSTIKTIIECNDESKNVTSLDNISAIYKMKRAAKLNIDEEIIESMWKVACENIKEDCNIVNRLKASKG